MSYKIEIVNLTPESSAPPGAEIRYQFAITNRSEITDQVQLQVLAVPSGAAQVVPPGLNLLPGESGTVEVRIRLPARAPTGSFPAVLRAFLTTNPAEATDLNFELTVAPQLAFQAEPEHPSGQRPVRAEIAPASQTADPVGKYSIHLANTRLQPVEVFLSGIDPQDALAFQFQPNRLTLPPNGETEVSLQVRPKDRPRPNQPRLVHDLTVTVEAHLQQTLAASREPVVFALPARLIQPPTSGPRFAWLNRAIWAMLALLLLLTCGCLGLLLLPNVVPGMPKVPGLPDISQILNPGPTPDCGLAAAVVLTPPPLVVNMTAPSTESPSPATVTSIAPVTMAPLPAGGFLELPFPYDGGNVNFGGTTEQFRRASNRSASGGRINSFFDHLYPLYPASVNGASVGGREPRQAPAVDSVLTFGGLLGMGNSFGYSGHPGFDYSTFEYRKATTPLFAAADGFLAAVGVDAYGGHFIKIIHPVQGIGNYQTMYLHLDPDSFFQQTKALYAQQPGRPISAGTRIGTMGNTGLSSGHHLHFEVWFDRDHNGSFEGDERVDPYGFLPSSQFPTDPWSQVVTFTDGRGQRYNHQASPSHYLWKHPLGTAAEIPAGGGSVPGADGVGGSPESASMACVPAGSLPAGSTVILSWTPDTPPANDLAGTGNGCTLTALDRTGAPIQAFARPIPITLQFTTEQIKNFVPSSLAMYYLADDGRWQRLNTWLDLNRHRATASMPRPGHCGLLGQPAVDIVPPRTTITLEGERASADPTQDLEGVPVFTGPVRVSLVADDGSNGSGVQSIEYSTDGGQSWQVYRQPFVIQPGALPQSPADSDAIEAFGARSGEFTVLAVARDPTGNREEPPAIAGFTIDISRGIDLTGLWDEQGKTVRAVQITQTQLDVTARFVEPYVCDYRNGTGQKSTTSDDFSGTLTRLILTGEINVCFFGKQHATDAGIRPTPLRLEVSPDGNTLTGSWLNPDTGADVAITLIRKR